MYFYPRSPCGERLNGIGSTCVLIINFYPRSPCGERRPRFSGIAPHIYFYPRSPCGERPPSMVRQPATSRFLSTLSLRRATSLIRIIGFSGKVFLSTLSLRRATNTISSRIHRGQHFYPRSPCGERPLQNWRKPHGQKTFLSTLSLRRATQ